MGLFEFLKKKNDVPMSPVTEGEIGWGNSAIYGAGDFEKYNPDDLIGRKGWDVYSRMMHDDQIKAVMAFKKSAITSRGYFFNKDEANEQHEEMILFFQFIINNLKGSFTDNLISILSGLQNGFSVSEKIYKTMDFEGQQMWGIDRIKLRPFSTFQEGFKVDEHGNLIELKQIQGTKKVILPLDKIIHFVHQPDIDEHYGESDLRACYRSYWSKDIIIKFQNIHLERHGSPFVFAKVTKNLSDNVITKLKSLLKNLSSRSGGYVPDGVELDVIDNKRTDSFEKAIAQHDKAIAKSVLVPNLLGLTEQGSTGSYAQAEIHLQAFFMVLDSIAKRLEDVLNEQMFRQLAVWNFGTEDFPLFTFEAMNDEQKVKIATMWSDLVQKGAVTKSETDETHIRQLVGFPEKEENAEEPPEEELPGLEGLFPEDGVPEELVKQFADRPWLKRIDFAKMKTSFDRFDDTFITEMNMALAEGRASIEQQVIGVVGQKSMSNLTATAIAKIKLPSNIVTKLRKITRKNLNSVVVSSFDAAKKELPRKDNAKIIQPGMDLTQAEKFLASKAFKVAGVIDTDVLKYVQQILENGIKYDKTLTEIMVALETDANLASILPAVDAAGRAINVPARVETIARTNISEAINQGRDSLFKSPELKGFVQAYEYSSILDARTTEICNHLDGKILRDFSHYRPPNHFNCRSVLAAVTVIDDWDGKESPTPRIEPNKGFS